VQNIFLFAENIAVVIMGQFYSLLYKNRKVNFSIFIFQFAIFILH